jgi:hypothetical protein
MLQTLSLLCLALSLQMPAAIPFTTITRDDQSGIERKREVIVRTAGEWQALWKEHRPDAEPPRVDFAKSMAIGIFLGFRNTGGYTVEITSIARRGDEVIVTWKETKPGAGDVTSQVLTFPHHIVRLDRLEGKIVFQQDTNTPSR